MQVGNNYAILYQGDGDDVIVEIIDNDFIDFIIDLKHSNYIEFDNKQKCFEKFLNLLNQNDFENEDQDLKQETFNRIKQMEKYNGKWFVGSDGDYRLVLGCIIE